MSARNSVVPTVELVSSLLPSRLVQIDRPHMRVGRDPTSDICLDLKQISWRHLQISRRVDGTYEVEDVGSHNGTYLNGRKLAPNVPEALADGCQIRLCEVTLTFRTQAVELKEAGTPETTIVGSLHELSSQSLATRPEQAPVVLRTVLEICRQLGGTAELNLVLGRALDELFAIFRQAECGFIVTCGPDGKYIPRATRHGRGVDRPLSLSRTVVEHVLREGKAVLITDVADVAGAETSESLSGTGIRTALCVPVFGRDRKPIGIIQLDSRERKAAFRPEDLELLAAVAVPIGVVIENHSLIRERSSITAAAEVQAALLPRKRPEIPGYALWERYQPALEVGGDYYDYIPVEADVESGRRWAVALGDVSGKGMPAALLMANLCAEVRHLVRSGNPPSEVADRVNRVICEADIPGRFVTFVLTLLDANTHRLTVVNAGHMTPMIRRANGTIEVVGEAEVGVPLGIEPDTAFSTAETQLGPGDVVVLYTDGVSEAVGQKERFFGIDGLRATLEATRGGAAEVGDAVLRALRSHVGNRTQSDDIALVCFGRTD